MDRSKNSSSTALTLPVQALPALGLGSLEAYIQAVNRVPLLSAQEEQVLARRFRDSHDLEAAGRLVLAHLRYVVSLSRQYLGYGLPRADLIQEGNLGLMQAVKRFNPELGIRLVSYAVHWIKAAIHEYILRNWRLVKIATTKAYRKLFFSKSELINDSQDTDLQHANKLAHELGVKTQEVIDMQSRLIGEEVGLDSSAEDNKQGIEPSVFLTRDGDQPENTLSQKQYLWLQHEGLGRALLTLDARSRAIIEKRWLQDKPATLQDLGKEFGVSHERISQIEKSAFKKLQKQLQPFKN